MALDALRQGPPFAAAEEQPPAWSRQSPGGLGGLDDAILGAQMRLENAGASIPDDPVLGEFRRRVLEWAPSHAAYREARDRQRQAAETMLSRYAEVPERDDSEMWLRFASGMLAPTKTGQFGESLGYGTGALTDAYSKARDRYLNTRLKSGEVGYQVAKDDAAAERQAMVDSLGGVAKIAALERVQQLLTKPGAMSDLEKRVRAMGLDPRQPDGKRMMLQLAYTQSGSQEVKDTIAENPELTPGTPEFAEALKRRLTAKLGKTEGQIESADAARRLAEQRAANLAADLERERTRGQNVGPDPALAAQLGTVIAPANPYAPLSGKAREEFYQKMQKQYDKEGEDLSERLTKARDFGREAKRALELLVEEDPRAEGGYRYRIPTGGVFAIPGMSAVAGALHPVYGELKAIQARISPMLRVAGSGAMSDFDARQLLSATFGPEKPGPANVNLAKGFIAAAKRIEEYQDARERFFMANKHTQGFEPLWKQYVESNPLLGEDRKSGILTLNRAPTFSEWLRKRQGAR